MRDDILVSVLCTAYNHEKFIKDTIEGVLKQKTNFKYELIIHDDASTDGTAAIVKQYADMYPEIIRVILQGKNQYMSCNIYDTYLFSEVRGKYIALCEGDDYWIDNMKLQKQIDFLEKNTEYSMCMHNAIKLNFETGEEKFLNTFPSDGTYAQEEQIRAGLGSDFPAFASYVLRTDLLKNMPHFFLEQKVVDYPIRQYYANCGKVYYFQEPMSVYRVSTPGSYMKKTAQSQLFYNNYTVEMIRFFEKFDNYTERKFHTLIKKKILSDYFGFCLSIEKNAGEQKARENGLDMKKIEACYQLFSADYLQPWVLELQKNAENIFIYGISRLSLVCKKQLEDAGIEFDGFVVSDGQMKLEKMDGKNVYYLKDVLAKYCSPGFILAIQPVNTNVIVDILESCNVKCYCKPYVIDNLEE